MSADARVPPARLARGVERVRHHLYRLHQRLVPAPVALSELVVGAWVAQAVQAAAERAQLPASTLFRSWIVERIRSLDPEGADARLRALIHDEVRAAVREALAS